MAKTTPDMIIQLNISAPGLEAAVTALTDAVTKISGGEVVIPAGSAVQITGVEAAPAAQPTQAVEQPAPAPQEVAQPTPTVAPAPQPTPVQAQAAPEVQATPQAVAPAPAPAASGVTLEAICNAGAKLVEQGQMNQVIALLGKYGVQAVNQIKPEQFDAFAADLRTLGAQI